MKNAILRRSESHGEFKVRRKKDWRLLVLGRGGRGEKEDESNERMKETFDRGEERDGMLRLEPAIGEEFGKREKTRVRL